MASTSATVVQYVLARVHILAEDFKCVLLVGSKVLEACTVRVCIHAALLVVYFIVLQVAVQENY